MDTSFKLFPLGLGKVYHYLEEQEMNNCDQENKLGSILLFPPIHCHFLKEVYAFLSFAMYLVVLLSEIYLPFLWLAWPVKRNGTEPFPAEVLRVIHGVAIVPFPSQWNWDGATPLVWVLEWLRPRTKSKLTRRHTASLYQMCTWAKYSIFLCISYHWSIT